MLYIIHNKKDEEPSQRNSEYVHSVVPFFRMCSLIVANIHTKFFTLSLTSGGLITVLVWKELESDLDKVRNSLYSPSAIPIVNLNN
ncbi:3067_t:CDS:2 [Entrophospora sp. SA101]|nr:3067_t:CDS:2 [Entrophospora sp. SA101]